MPNIMPHLNEWNLYPIYTNKLNAHYFVQTKTEVLYITALCVTIGSVAVYKWYFRHTFFPACIENMFVWKCQQTYFLTFCNVKSANEKDPAS